MSESKIESGARRTALTGGSHWQREREGEADQIGPRARREAKEEWAKEEKRNGLGALAREKSGGELSWLDGGGNEAEGKEEAREGKEI